MTRRDTGYFLSKLNSIFAIAFKMKLWYNYFRSKGGFKIMTNKIWRRNTLQYKIKMWFYHLAFQDIKSFIRKCANIIFEFIMCGIGLLLLTILPALFR